MNRHLARYFLALVVLSDNHRISCNTRSLDNIIIAISALENIVTIEDDIEKYIISTPIDIDIAKVIRSGVRTLFDGNFGYAIAAIHDRRTDKLYVGPCSHNSCIKDRNNPMLR